MRNDLLVLHHRLIAKDTYELVLETNFLDVKPGQFVEIKVNDEYFLRRPLSICSYDNGRMVLLYKVVGAGTKALSQIGPLKTLDVLGPLGNGYTINTQSEHALLIGGGIGIPPLYQLAKTLKAQGLTFSIILGFNKLEDVFYEDEFKALTDHVYVTTMDGSYGFEGTTVDLIHQHDIAYDYYYTCGPKPMLMALLKEKPEGQLSFEERMGCGFGACMGCSVKTNDGYKRICREGPVLQSKEVMINE